MGVKKSLIGSRFGRLTVIGEKPERKDGKIVWLCKCDCGGEASSVSFRLTNSFLVSCGCFRKEKTIERNTRDKNLTGKRFGMLLVLEHSHQEVVASTGKNQNMWSCVCDCGQTAKVSTNALCNSNTSSCGCLRFRSRPMELESKENTAIATVRRNAEARNIAWEMSRADTLQLLYGNCYYCDAGPSEYKKTRIKRNGIDRIDSAKSYFPANCVSCCYQCNLMKHAVPYDDFLNKVASIYNNLNLSRLEKVA